MHNIKFSSTGTTYASQAPYRNQAPALVSAAPEVPVQGPQSVRRPCQQASSGERRKEQENQQNKGQHAPFPARRPHSNSRANFGVAISGLAGAGMPGDGGLRSPLPARKKNSSGRGPAKLPSFAFPRPSFWRLGSGRSNDHLASRHPFFIQPQPAHPKTAAL